jgi:AcrR family transcriptional regulator
LTIMRESPFAALGFRAIATMEAIEVAALREFWARGFDETTAEHIAAASGVSVRTFFRYFPRGKEDVMVLEFRRWVHQLADAMRERPPHESAWTAAREAVRSIRLLGGAGGALSVEAVWMHHQVARRHPELHGRMTGYQHGLIEPLVQMAALRMSVDPTVDIRPRLMVHAMITAATVAWLAWLADSDVVGFIIFEQALDIFENGMARALAPITAPAL